MKRDSGPHAALKQEQQHETFASRDELLKEIKSHSRRGGGLSFNQLKTTWNGAPAVIEELESEGLILVTRSSKDGQPKMVFWNDIPPQEGGKQIEPGEHITFGSALF